MTKDEAFNTFIGGWQLVGATNHHADGSRSEPLGSQPIGQIMYSRDGHMTAHLLPGGKGAYGSTPPYIGYFGRFSVDPAKQVVTHHVVGASTPEMIGTDQPRDYSFEGDRLILQVDRPEGRAKIVWEKRDERG